MFRKSLILTLALIILLAVSACAPAAIPTLVPTIAPTVAPTTAPTLAPTSTAVPTATNIPATATPSSLTITDAAGRSVTISGVPGRIISLAPSNTEILYALDLRARVVAVDDFSDFPAEAKSQAKIGGSNGKYNIEQIVALKPDLVLAAGITAPDVVKQLTDLKLTVVELGAEKTTFDSIFADITLVGQITGQSDKAKSLVEMLKQKRDAIATQIATAKTKPRVYWELDASDVSKPFTIGPGSFVNDIITLAGGVNIFANVSSPYPQVSSEQIVSANPEVIILSDAAYGITVDSVLKRAGWQNIAAVKNKQVYPIDDNLVSRPGPRIVDGLAAAAKLIHLELFP